MKRTTATGLLLALALLGACQSTPQQAAEEASEAGLQVLQVSPSELGPTPHGREEPGLAEACHDWQLSPAQVKRFFELAEPVDSQEMHRRFYFLPCRITGELQAEGCRWRFSINAAATGSWQCGERRRWFGCSAAECASLVVLMPDEP